MRPLTEAEREVVVTSKAQGIDFAQVTPSMLFSKTADGGLGHKVHRLRPDVYYSLKLEWLYQIGAEPRPLEQYSGVKQ
jgi:hypothetical protein